MYFITLNNKIFKFTQIYFDKVLNKYELSKSSCSYLFILEKNPGITQNKIIKKVGNDKAMVSRTITKLIDLDYIYRDLDVTNHKYYKLYLTKKAQNIMPKIHEDVNTMMRLVTEDLSEQENHVTMKSLKKIFKTTERLIKSE